MTTIHWNASLFMVPPGIGSLSELLGLGRALALTLSALGRRRLGAEVRYYGHSAGKRLPETRDSVLGVVGDWRLAHECRVDPPLPRGVSSVYCPFQEVRTALVPG